MESFSEYRRQIILETVVRFPTGSGER